MPAKNPLLAIDSPLAGGGILVYVVAGDGRRTAGKWEGGVFSIGEFSRISGLSVKTLRFYHERGLLMPSCVDDESGYRYYDHASVEKARVIASLREMEFSLGEIKEMLDRCDDQADVLDALERQKGVLEGKIRRYRIAARSLDHLIATEREAKTVMESSTLEVQEKTLEPMLIAGFRMKAKYSDCGQGFAKVCKAFGRQACGPVLNLYYDGEYRDDDADMEPCVPIRQGKEVEGISVRELPGGRCVALLHQGPYEQMGRSYEKILAYIKAKGYDVLLPTREVYLKGPGMLFKGNPKKYLTEIQMLIEV
jgi:DNA-binding transcriptional MerR regulator